jgi:hypothetical protein
MWCPPSSILTLDDHFLQIEIMDISSTETWRVLLAREGPGEGVAEDVAARPVVGSSPPGKERNGTREAARRE